MAMSKYPISSHISALTRIDMSHSRGDTHFYAQNPIPLITLSHTHILHLTKCSQYNLTKCSFASHCPGDTMFCASNPVRILKLMKIWQCQNTLFQVTYLPLLELTCLIVVGIHIFMHKIQCAKSHTYTAPHKV
jgi:hypothetical protein